jgi:hypothetical protein
MVHAWKEKRWGFADRNLILVPRYAGNTNKRGSFKWTDGTPGS